MLRSRKKDVRIKPNRKLDKRSSRGMLYENEELRLRTIEINAEVEKGQSDVKKLRRENDHLRREMWVLRDEYERLENLIKQLDLVPGGAVGGSAATSCGGSRPDSAEMSDSDTEDQDDNPGSAEENHYSESGQRSPYGKKYRYGRNRSAEMRNHSDVDDLYVEADGTNPDADNLENYQKVYGRMPTNYCTVSLPQTPTGISAPSGDEQSPVLADHPEEAKPGYASHCVRSCSHPHLLDSCSNVDPVPMNAIPPPDSFSSTALPPLLPASPLQAEGAEFNFDQLVNIVQSFQLDQKQHEQGCSENTVASPTPPAGPTSQSYATVRRHCHTVVERKEVRNIAHGGQTQLVRESVKEMALATPPTSAATNSATSATSQSVIFTQTSSSNAGTSGIRQSVTFRQDSVVVVPNHVEELPPPPPPPSVDEGGRDETGNQLVCSSTNLPYLRLHAIDPHTVSFNLSDHEVEWRKVSVQEIIDELEQQLNATLCAVNGVRLTNDRVFISLKERQSLLFLLKNGFILRGIRVQLRDITDNAVVVILTGVPHYISDSTVAMLLSAFGTVIGDLERRFYKGVDTGERLVRLRVKPHTKLPKHVTVGGCKIIVKILPLQDNSTGPSAESSASQSCPNTIRRYKPGQNQSNHRPMSCVPAESARDSLNPLRHSTSASLSLQNPQVAGESQESDPGLKRSTATIDITHPRIDKAFEYRSQLSVNLRLSTELPVPPGESTTTADDSKSRVSATDTPPSPLCDLKLHPLSPQGLANVQAYQRQTPTRDLSRFRKNAADFSPSVIQRKVEARRSNSSIQRLPGTPEATPPPLPRLKDSPPKTRVSVNFEETQPPKLRPCPIPKPASASPNGILRKSITVDEPNATNNTPANDSTTAPGTPVPGTSTAANRKSGSAESGKPSRSFSLVDTFRSRSADKKRSQDGVVDNLGTNNDNETAASHVRRDSVKSSGSSSKSSRSSRKSGAGELPWCGCWGNGCL